MSYKFAGEPKMQKSNFEAPPDIGKALVTLRKSADKSQGEIAKTVRTDNSRLSRIESGELAPTQDEVVAYLEALGTEAARAYMGFLAQPFKHLNRPAFDHPEREVLLNSERMLQRLDEFSGRRDLPDLLTGAAKLHRQTLLASCAYLSSTHHHVAFVGRTGVGKTLAICKLTALMLPDGDAGTNQPVLETGTGGTTICEVRVQYGYPGGIRIEPMPKEEIERLVSELCAGLAEPAPATRGDEDRQQVKSVPEEFRRALLNMAKLAPRTIRGPNGKPLRINRLKPLLEQFSSLQALRAAVEERLTLDQRLERELRYEIACGKSFANWLKHAYTEINNGRNPSFSIPSRIDVLAPQKILNEDRFTLQAIDTKGIDQAVMRPDLQACIHDDRTLVLLCSVYSGAPEPTIHDLLQQLAQIGSERALENRVALLVLPRNNEPLQTKDLDGTRASSVEEGYLFKEEQIREAFKRIGVPADLGIIFFDALSSPVADVSAQIVKIITSMREAHVKRINEVSNAIEQLLEEREEALARIAQDRVMQTLETFWNGHVKLERGKARAVPVMLQAVRDSPPRSVWATTRRAGRWSNIDVYLQLGMGARIEVQARSRAAFDALDALLKNMLSQEGLNPVRGLLTEVQANVPLWREKFLESARRSGEAIFSPSLSDDEKFWAECEDIYGRGMQFRHEVANKLEAWFDHVDREEEHNLLQQRMQEAWTAQVLEPLAEVCGKNLAPPKIDAPPLKKVASALG